MQAWLRPSHRDCGVINTKGASTKYLKGVIIYAIIYSMPIFYLIVSLILNIKESKKSNYVDHDWFLKAIKKGLKV